MTNNITFFGSKEYKHSEYTTATKQKTLPEEVKIAILGEKYVAPIVNEPEVVEEVE